MKVIKEDEIWVLRNDGNVNIAFHKIGEKYFDSTDVYHQFDNNTKIVFEIEDDLETIRKEFLAKNIPMRKLKTFEEYDCCLCYGTGPEGNVFQLKKRK